MFSKLNFQTFRPAKPLPLSSSWKTTACPSPVPLKERSTREPLVVSPTSLARAVRLTGAAVSLTEPDTRFSIPSMDKV